MKEEKAKEIEFEVTEQDYQEELDRGVDPDYALKPGRYTARRGSFRERHPGFDAKEALAQARVRVNVWLDLDVLNYFKQRAEQPGAEPCETQISKALREFVERDKRAGEQSRLLDDVSFIAAVAERVKDHLEKQK